jgi:hypothetical protein
MSALSEAFGDWLESVAAHKECVEGCDYDAGYFCFYQRERMEADERRFLDALRQALATPHEQQTEPSPTHEPSSSVARCRARGLSDAR